jgi:hypothetical protein
MVKTKLNNEYKVFTKLQLIGQSNVQGFNKNWLYHIDGHVMSLYACIHKSTFVDHLLSNIHSMTPNFDDSPLIKHQSTSNKIIQCCIMIRSSSNMITTI